LEINLLTTAILLITIVLLFEFSNGFNDCANMVVTPVITGALEPRKALLLIAVFEFIGAWFLGTAVAQTLGKGIVDPQYMTLPVIFAAVCGAILWNVGGWYFGMPSSSSHALIGGLVGAVATGSGAGWIHWVKVAEILAILVLTPVIGLLGGRYLTRKVFVLFQDMKPSRANPRLKRLQILTSITLALSHGTNDAQKTMGIITLALVTGGYLTSFAVPVWVIILCAGMIALGTAVGGWKLIKTLGGKFYKIRPLDGLASQVASAAVILGASLVGGPVSTTQVVSSSIMGVGAAERANKVRWGVAQEIAVAWLLTIPATGLLAAGIYWLITNLIP